MRSDSALLYALFLSGDGNFHLHRRDNQVGASEAAQLRARSMIGDAGFWAPKATFQTYISASSAIPDKDGKVALVQTPGIVQLLNLLF